MKYAILIGDGMADWPLEELQNRTPLEASRVPNLNRLAAKGQTGWAVTVPEGVAPGSDVANMSIFGYDPLKYYSGRAPLEAASLGILLSHDEIAFRCNLVTVQNGIMEDFTAGHIDTKAATAIIERLNEKLGTAQIKFYPGLSYRHLLVIKETVPSDKKLLTVHCIPPHDITGKSISDKIPSGEGAEILRKLMKASLELLADHPQNRNRKKPATMIWLWGQGKAPDFPKFHAKYKLTGAVITAVPLIKGIGIFAGLEVIDVPGATGFLDTNYAGKVSAALKVLEVRDLVFVHVEAPDEAGHMGDVQLKVKAIEDFDQKVVGPMLKGLAKFKDYRIMVLPDHPTPIQSMTHTAEPVPYVIAGAGKGTVAKTKEGKARAYNEKAVPTESGKIKGHELLKKMITLPGGKT